MSGPGDQRSRACPAIGSRGSRRATANQRAVVSAGGARAPCRERTAAERPEPRAALECRERGWSGTEGPRVRRAIARLPLARRAAGCARDACERGAPVRSDPARQPACGGANRGPPVLFTCAGFPGRCTPARLEATRGTDVVRGLGDAAGLGDRFGPNPVYVCRATADGACPPRQIGQFRRRCGPRDRPTPSGVERRDRRRSRRLLLRGPRPHRRVSRAAAHRHGPTSAIPRSPARAWSGRTIATARR